MTKKLLLEDPTDCPYRQHIREEEPPLHRDVLGLYSIEELQAEIDKRKGEKND